MRPATRSSYPAASAQRGGGTNEGHRHWTTNRWLHQPVSRLRHIGLLPASASRTGSHGRSRPSTATPRSREATATCTCPAQLISSQVIPGTDAISRRYRTSSVSSAGPGEPNGGVPTETRRAPRSAAAWASTCRATVSSRATVGRSAQTPVVASIWQRANSGTARTSAATVPSSSGAMAAGRPSGHSSRNSSSTPTVAGPSPPPAGEGSTAVPGSAVTWRHPRAAGASPDRLEHRRGERLELLLPVPDHDARGLGHLAPGAAQPAQGLTDHQPGVLGEPVQHRVVRVLRTQRADVGVVEQRPGPALGGVTEGPERVAVRRRDGHLDRELLAVPPSHLLDQADGPGDGRRRVGLQPERERQVEEQLRV